MWNCRCKTYKCDQISSIDRANAKSFSNSQECWRQFLHSLVRQNRENTVKDIFFCFRNNLPLPSNPSTLKRPKKTVPRSNNKELTEPVKYAAMLIRMNEDAIEGRCVALGTSQAQSSLNFFWVWWGGMRTWRRWRHRGWGEGGGSLWVMSQLSFPGPGSNYYSQLQLLLEAW